MRKTEMNKLNITKEQFNRSRYFKDKYGKLEYVSESGRMFKTDKGKVLMFKESWNKDDYDDQPRKFRPKFDIGDKVRLTDDFFTEYPIHDTSDYYYHLIKGSWMIEDVKTDDGIEGATGLHRPYYQYYIIPLGDDDETGIWVDEPWIKKSGGSFKESTKKFDSK